ncbi:MAG: transcriptional regulator of a riboflavin/FAD biosynthetic operon [Halonotius sp. J07HN6]|nr:MAG: transcriptional regulator of a riboflavin/FAD biosynthetic operon [Halonotius sp. J07HN6]
MAESAAGTLGHDELLALKLVALDGGLASATKVSCGDLGDRLEASNQTASRRLQALEAGDYIDRDIVADGQWVTISDAGERALRSEYADYRRLFEEESGLTLTGSVTSGMGEGKHYITLPGYERQFETKLGYTPFPGTLNIDLDDASIRARAELEAQASIPDRELGGRRPDIRRGDLLSGRCGGRRPAVRAGPRDRPGPHPPRRRKHRGYRTRQAP